MIFTGYLRDFTITEQTPDWRFVERGDLYSTSVTNCGMPLEVSGSFYVNEADMKGFQQLYDQPIGGEKMVTLSWSTSSTT